MTAAAAAGVDVAETDICAGVAAVTSLCRVSPDTSTPAVAANVDVLARVLQRYSASVAVFVCVLLLLAEVKRHLDLAGDDLQSESALCRAVYAASLRAVPLIDEGAKAMRAQLVRGASKPCSG